MFMALIIYGCLVARLIIILLLFSLLANRKLQCFMKVFFEGIDVSLTFLNYDWIFRTKTTKTHASYDDFISIYSVYVHVHVYIFFSHYFSINSLLLQIVLSFPCYFGYKYIH